MASASHVTVYYNVEALLVHQIHSAQQARVSIVFVNLVIVHLINAMELHVASFNRVLQALATREFVLDATTTMEEMSYYVLKVLALVMEIAKQPHALMDSVKTVTLRSNALAKHAH
jgi:SHS2 domain-containing protein